MLFSAGKIKRRLSRRKRRFDFELTLLLLSLARLPKSPPWGILERGRLVMDSASPSY